MNFTTTKTDRGVNYVSSEVKKPAPVSESEIKSRISAIKNSLSSSKFDPHALTKQYQAVTEGRGYSVFDNEGRQAWENEFGHMDHASIRKLANFHADAFMKTVNDPSCKDHLQARDRFKNEFGASEENVRNHFISKTNAEYGKTFRGGPSCNQDVSYEGRMCATSPVSNQTGLAEKETLNGLMRARWDAQGYREGTGTDDDQPFVDRFYNEYAIELKPAKNIVK